MRSLILLAMAILLCSSAALSQTNSTHFNELMGSALQALVVDSTARLDSYRFFMEMEQKVDLVDLSSGDAQRLDTRSFGYGMANMTDRALMLFVASLTNAKGDADNSSATVLELYLTNDTIYMKVDGNWTALKMPGVADSWSAQGTISQQINMLNQSHLTLMGSEKVGGQDCYKVRAEMDMSAMADQLSADAASLVPMQGMNSELFDNMSLDVCYWISKDTHLLRKTDVTESFIMTPQSLGLPSNESMEMRINAKVSMLFEGFNESANINLPAEAAKAQTFPLGLLVSTEEVPVFLANNETDVNESVRMHNETLSENKTAQIAMTA